MTKILTKTILAQEFAAFKLLHPLSHVGRYPTMTDLGPMKWIMVYPSETEDHSKE